MNISVFGLLQSDLVSVASADGSVPGIPVWIGAMILFCGIFLAITVHSIVREWRAIRREEERASEAGSNGTPVIDFRTVAAARQGRCEGIKGEEPLRGLNP